MIALDSEYARDLDAKGFIPRDAEGNAIGWLKEDAVNLVKKVTQDVDIISIVQEKGPIIHNTP